VYRPDRGKGPVDTLATMISEFNWWLLLLGLAVGGGLTWLVMAETRRREQDLEEADLVDEAVWLEERLAEEGREVSPDTIERVVQLHREYLAVVPPADAADMWRTDEVALTSEDAWRTAGWEEPAARSPEGEPPLELAPPELTAPVDPAPEAAAPDEPGVRHEDGGG
jgi:hypothetical protein